VRIARTLRMPARRSGWFPDESDRESPANRDGVRGLERDYAGMPAAGHYHGGSVVEQSDTTRAGPYVGLGPKGYTRSDETIHDDVCDRLMRSGYVDATEVEVRVSSGEVTLGGWVGDRDQKRLAEDVADAVAGVRDVHNRIRVRRAFAAGVEETRRRDGSS
jgi:osmotically-inducible protein OsmY